MLVRLHIIELTLLTKTTIIGFSIRNRTRTNMDTSGEIKSVAQEKKQGQSQRTQNHSDDVKNGSKNKFRNRSNNSKCKQRKNKKRQRKRNNHSKVHPTFPTASDTIQETMPNITPNIVALDCEMVGVGPEGMISALARVCIVDWNHNVIYDSHVKVYEPVTDYRTFVSGIRAEDIESDEAVDFEECRTAVKQILKGKILVGHALRNDLNALEIYDHPWYDIRDTAKYEPFMKRVSKESTMLGPRKLKDLSLTKLKREIQRDGEEHCPKEDAIAALDLYKKARTKWEKAMEYKVQRTREIESESDASSAC